MNKELEEYKQKIKNHVERIIERDIEGREKKVKRKRYVQTTRLRRIKERILFYIDNPDYIPINEKELNI